MNWSPGCGFCTKIAGQLGELEQPLRDEGVELVFLTMGDEEQHRGVRAEAGAPRRCSCAPRVPVTRSAGTGTPAAYLLDEAG